MKINLLIQNLQCIKEARFSFEAGLNLISGPNSSGKSAIFRAIRALILNKAITAKWIKHGERKAVVAMEVTEQKPVAWVKTSKGTVYQVGKSVFEKMGRGGVFSVYPDFPFLVDENNELLQMQGEWDCLFPFSRTPSQMFKLFEAVNQVVDSLPVYGYMKGQEGDLNYDIKRDAELIEGISENWKLLGEFVEVFDLDKYEVIKKNFSLSESKNNVIEKDYLEFKDYFIDLEKTFENHNLLTAYFQEFEITEIDDLKKLLTNFENLHYSFVDDIQNFEASYALEQDLPDIDMQDFDFGTVVILEEMECAMKEFVVLKDLITQGLKIEEELDEKREILKGIGICPMCGSQLPKGL